MTNPSKQGLRRVLVVAPCFAPAGVVGAQRPVKLVRALPSLGIEPFVLTVSEACQWRASAANDRDVLDTANITATRCMSPWTHGLEWRAEKRLARRLIGLATRAFATATGRFVPLDVWSPWIPGAVRAGVRLVREHNIDLIWSTGPPVTGLAVAAQIAARTGVPYAVDYRDLTPETPDQRRVMARERALVAGASALSYVVPVHGKQVRERFGPLGDKPVRLVRNWFERRDCQGAAMAFDHPTLFYGGSLYGGLRRIDGLMEALAAQLGDSGPLHLELFAGEARQEPVLEAADRAGVGPLVHIRREVPRAEFMQACRGADVLLVIIGHNADGVEHAGGLPGKLYDYLACRRPILVIGPADCESARLVESFDRGMGARDDDPQAIVAALASLRAGQGRSGPLDLSVERVLEVEAVAAVRQMVDLMSLATLQNRG